MIVKLLIKHHFEFLSLTGGCRGSSESIHAKMPHCWKSHAMAQIFFSVRHSENKGLIKDRFLHTMEIKNKVTPNHLISVTLC